MCVSTETGWPPVFSERIVLKSYRLFDRHTIHQVVSFPFGGNHVVFYVDLRIRQRKHD